MQRVTGIFDSVSAARAAYDQLSATPDTGPVELVLPHDTSRLQQLYVTEAVRPRIGEKVWQLTLGSTGALLSVIACAVVFGADIISILGVVSTFMALAVGAIAGAMLGVYVDRTLAQRAPADDLFVYEDALEHGDAVVVVDAVDERSAAPARDILAANGALSPEVAHERWWTELRDQLVLEERAQGYDLRVDEARYRLGFEAAQRHALMDYDHDEALFYLRDHFQPDCNYNSFLRGFERGRLYRQHHRAHAH